MQQRRRRQNKRLPAPQRMQILQLLKKSGAQTGHLLGMRCVDLEFPTQIQGNAGNLRPEVVNTRRRRNKPRQQRLLKLLVRNNNRFQSEFFRQPEMQLQRV